MKIYLDKRLYGKNKVITDNNDTKCSIYIDKPLSYDIVIVPPYDKDWVIGLDTFGGIFVVYNEKTRTFSIPIDNNMRSFVFVKNNDLYVSLHTKITAKNTKKYISVSSINLSHSEYQVIFNSEDNDDILDEIIDK